MYRDYIQYIIIYLILSVTYIIFVNFNGSELNLTSVDILSFMLSLMFLIRGIDNFIKKGINIGNVFLIVFFGGLFLNSLPVSRYQEQKEIADIYFFYIGPTIFYLILSFSDKIKVKRINSSRKFTTNNNNIAYMILFIYIILKIYIFKQTGVRFFSSEWSSQHNAKYVISGISGLSELLMWVLVMYIPHINKKLKVIILVSVILFSSVLVSARGDMFRIGIYLLSYYLVSKKSFSFNRIKQKKLIKKIVIMILLILSLFTILGEYRQYIRGNRVQDAFSISEDLNSRIDSKLINWTYGYTAINFDVLKVTYISKFKDNPFKKINALKLPYIRIFKGNNALSNVLESYPSDGIDGINASTFLSKYIADLGFLYWIEIIGLGIIISIFIILSKAYEFTGLYCFLLMLITLTIFGDYIMNPNYFISMPVTLLLWIMLDGKGNSFMNKEDLIDINV